MRGGDYVMMARHRAGLTQRQLAERLGLRQATIARWERGDRGVSVDDVELVAHACGLQLDAHLLIEDRSWWPQIAMQLELDPLERVRTLTLPGAPDIAAGLSELAGAGVPALIIGDVAVLTTSLGDGSRPATEDGRDRRQAARQLIQPPWRCRRLPDHAAEP